MRKHRRFVVAALVVAALGGSSIAAAQTTGPVEQVAPSPDPCQQRFTLDQHREVMKSVDWGGYAIDRKATANHTAMVNCAASPQEGAVMDAVWTQAVRKHRHYVHAVLAYPGGRNPLGGRKWATPYCIVVGESGAGSGSSNYYGLLAAWPEFRRPQASQYGSAGSAPFWEQSVAAYNTRQQGFGGWSTSGCMG